MPLIKSASPKAVGNNITKLKDEGYPRAQRLAIALQTQRDAKKRRAMWEGGEVMDDTGLEWADKPAINHPNNTSGETDTSTRPTESDPEMEEGWGDIEPAPGGRVNHGNSEGQGDREYKNSEVDRLAYGGVPRYSEGGMVGHQAEGSDPLTRGNQASGKGNAGSARPQTGTTNGDNQRGDQDRPDLSHDFKRYLASTVSQNNSEVRPTIQDEMKTFGDDSPSGDGDETDMVAMARKIRKRRFGDEAA